MAQEPGQPASPVAVKYLRLQLARHVGPVVLRRLLERFRNIDAVLAASGDQLARVKGVGPERARAILEARQQDQAERETARAAEYGVRIVCLEDADYPASLRHIPDSPICLYVRGTLQREDAVAVAMVGARRCTHYGCEQARRFGAALAGAGFTVVSGLARGIDGYSHEGALAAGGRTLAVLGNGLAHVYPPEHTELAERVAASGALLTELPLETAPEATNFPRRNRIIIGLSLGVIVVEAGRRSGALITARLASEYNREVFAVPGRLDSHASFGTNTMIRDGQAKLVACLEDVLDELGEVGRITRRAASEPAETPAAGDAPLPRLSTEQELVWNAVPAQPTDLASICRGCGLSVGTVTSTLTVLQLKGIVQQLPGDRFARRAGP